MKKLKLDLTQIQVLSFTVETAKGSGTVNAHITESDFDCDIMYGGTAGTSGTDIKMTCASCPSECDEQPLSYGGYC